MTFPSWMISMGIGSKSKYYKSKTGRELGPIIRSFSGSWDSVSGGDFLRDCVSESESSEPVSASWIWEGFRNV